MLEQIIDVFEVNTDAVATNKGFYYQYLTILKKWIVNFIENNNMDAYTEVDQDIKEVGDNLVFTQVKCYTSNFNLNSEEVKSTVFNFFLLYLKNKETVSNVSFCFSTNSSIAPREKLLAKWVNDNKLTDKSLNILCCSKIKEILVKEIKSKKNKKLGQKKTADKRDLIKLTADNLLSLVNDEVENFTKLLEWKFDNLSPDEAINTIKQEIDNLLKNEKFNGRPIVLLFGVFISEIYKKSQNKNPSDRCLTKDAIINLLSYSDAQLEEYWNSKFFKLISIEMEMLRTEIQSIQSEVQEHHVRIDSLEKKIISHATELPRILNLTPDYNSINIYGWEDFLQEVNSRLASTKLLSVYGPGGMGKTSFAKKYLKTFSGYDHIIWITVENLLSFSFVFDEVLIKNLNLYFSPKDETQYRFKIILNTLNAIEGTNLIIIDIQELEDDKNSINLLSGLSNWQKLILTRNNIKTIPTVKLQQLDIEDAKRIFYSHYSKEAIEDLLLGEFIEYIDYNILVIELAAKTIENSFDLTLEQFFNSLKEQNLNDEEYNIDIDLMEEDNTIKIFNYLLKKFSLISLNPFEKIFLEFLAVLPSRDIIIEDVILIYGKDLYKENKIYIINLLNSFDKKGLIEFSIEKKRINIHKIIKQVVVYNARATKNPFLGTFHLIISLTARIKEGQNNPSISFRYLKYAQSILDNIKEDYRKSIYQPLIILENELLFAYRYYIDDESPLKKWMDLEKRSEQYLKQNDVNRGVINNNLGLAYIEVDIEKAKEQFEKALKLFNENEKLHTYELITTLNNISNVYLKSKDIINAVNIFKRIQDMRKKYNLYDDHLLVIEHQVLSECYKICGDINKAIKTMERGVVLHFDLDKEKRNDFQLSSYYDYLSQLYLLKDDLDMGIEYKQNAIAVLEAINLGNSNYLLSLYKITKLLYKAKGLTEKEKIITNKINSFENFQITGNG